MIKTEAPFKTGDVVQYSTRRIVPGQLSFINVRVDTVSWTQGEYDDYPQWYINGTVLNVSGVFQYKTGDRATVAARDFRKI